MTHLLFHRIPFLVANSFTLLYFSAVSFFAAINLNSSGFFCIFVVPVVLPFDLEFEDALLLTLLKLDIRETVFISTKPSVVAGGSSAGTVQPSCFTCFDLLN